MKDFEVSDYYDLPENVVSIVSLSSYANEVKLLTSKSRSYILKKYNSGNKECILQRQNVLAELRTLGVHIPNSIYNKAHELVTETEQGIYELTEYIPHKTLNYHNITITPKQLEQAAELLAKLHSVVIPRQSRLTRVNFSNVNLDVTTLINRFNKLDFDTFTDRVLTRKLLIIRDFLKHTTNKRNKFLSTFDQLSFVRSQEGILHGDFSLTNLCYSKLNRQLYIVDWDSMKIGPRTFELQRSIGLLCGKGECNANLDSIDKPKLKIFLSRYLKESYPMGDYVAELVEVAEYCFLIYWLQFTLRQILTNDYRILELFPNRLGPLLFWEANLGLYKKILTSI